MDAWNYAIAAFLRVTVVPVVAAAVLAVPLWLMRRYTPRAARWLYGPLYDVTFAIGRAAGRAVHRLIRPRH